MKRLIPALAIAVFCLMFVPQAHAWDCPTGQIRQQAPIGTPTTTPYYDVVEGIAFICVPATPPTTPTTPVTSNSNSNSSANSAANSTANSASNSSATNSTRVSTKQNQSQNQTQTQSASVSNSGNSSASANGNGDNSNNYNSVTNVPRDVATAYAPTVMPTTPCFKGFSGGGQGTMFGFSFGGGKIDLNCAALEASRLAPSLLARCKVYITIKAVKTAGVTLDDCLLQNTTPVAVIAPQPQPTPIQTAPVITVNVPAPVVTVIPAPVVPAQPSVAVAAKAVVHKPRPACKCVVTNDNINKQ